MYFSPVLIGFGLASYGSTESHSRFNSGNLDERFLERVHHQSPSAHCFKYKKKLHIIKQFIFLNRESRAFLLLVLSLTKIYLQLQLVGSAVNSLSGASNKALSGQQKKINIGQKKNRSVRLLSSREKKRNFRKTYCCQTGLPIHDKAKPNGP